MTTNPDGADPRFTQEVLSANATWASGTTAKTTLNDTVNAVKILTFGPYGGLLKKLTARPLATVTATRLVALRKRAADAGAAAHLAAAAVMANQTVSATADIVATAFPIGADDDDVFRGGPNEEVWVGASVTGVTIEFDAEYENF